MWKLARVCLRALAFGISAYAGALHAQEPLVAYKSLTPALALELAQATLADCQKRGFQAAVAGAKVVRAGGVGVKVLTVGAVAMARRRRRNCSRPPSSRNTRRRRR